MPLKLDDKKRIVAEVAEVASTAYSAVTAEYRGMKVEDITKLRVKAREAGVYIRVVRNTLARRAVQDTDFACLQDVLVGPLVLAFSQSDPGAAARVMRDFTKENKTLVVKNLAISGQLLDASQLDVLAKMPTYDEAISMLMSVMKAPITKLVRTIQEPHAKLVRTFAAVREAKENA